MSRENFLISGYNGRHLTELQKFYINNEHEMLDMLNQEQTEQDYENSPQVILKKHTFRFWELRKFVTTPAILTNTALYSSVSIRVSILSKVRLYTAVMSTEQKHYKIVTIYKNC